MSTLALSLLILACGWKLYKDWRVTRYAALSNEGHPQYFAAAIAAAYLSCLAAAIHAACGHFAFYRNVVGNALTYVPIFVGDHEIRANVNLLAGITIWVAFLTVFVGWFFNRPLFRSSSLLVAVAKKAGAVDELEQLLHRCLEKGLLVALTLKSAKVYIGIPEGSAPFSDERTWVRIWPMASGYRDQQGTLHITTHYKPQYSRIDADQAENIEREDFEVILPRCEITSAQSFDLATHQHFMAARDGRSRRAGDGNAPKIVIAGKAVVQHEQPLAAEQGIEEDDDYALLSREIVSDGSRLQLSMYWAFITLFSIAVLALPQSACTSIVVGLLALLAAWRSSPAAFR